MTTLAASTAPDAPRNLWKSTGAVLLGIVVVFVLSLGTDQVFHVLGIYPPWGEVMQGTGLYLPAPTQTCRMGLRGAVRAVR